MLFATIAQDLLAKGYSIRAGALPADISNSLLLQLQAMPEQQFLPAGIGREQDQMLNRFVRKDTISWITGASAAGLLWLDWAAELQTYLNRVLFLGLFSFESHFAHYAKGAFYRRHIDAFKGDSNRVLSVVAYLNPGWQAADGGELVLYPQDYPDGLKVCPEMGTLAVFLSAEFEHEVLPTTQDRYSVAGWFRVNGSNAQRADPPL